MRESKSDPNLVAGLIFLFSFLAGLFHFFPRIMLGVVGFVIFLLLVNYLRGEWLIYRVRKEWFAAGKHILLVYSNSPNWKDYFEQTILPHIEPVTKILNWSERSQWQHWRRPLEQKIFIHFSSISTWKDKGKRIWYGRAYVPVAILFKPRHRPKVLRFWQPLKDARHGKAHTLRSLEEELLRVAKL